MKYAEGWMVTAVFLFSVMVDIMAAFTGDAKTKAEIVFAMAYVGVGAIVFTIAYSIAFAITFVGAGASASAITFAIIFVLAGMLARAITRKNWVSIPRENAIALLSSQVELEHVDTK